jgi:AcrR family transcriptional regulator
MSTRICEQHHTPAKNPVRVPTQARSRATVDAILGGAAEVLTFRGYAKTTTNHIAAAAGVSIGSVYQYFGDKDAVIAAVAEKFATETLAFSRKHVDDAREGEARVSAWVAALATRVEEQEALLRVLFQEVPYTWSTSGVRDAMAAALEVVERLDTRAHGTDRERERALVILKSAVAVLLELATDASLRERRQVIVEELATMIVSYLYGSAA